MCFLFLLLFCIIKIKCFFFTFVFLFIWMQVWSLEKEDTPHSFSSRVFLHYYKFYFLIFYSLFGFFFFVIFFLLKLFYCIFACSLPLSLAIARLRRLCMMCRTKIRPKERRSLPAFGIQKEWDTIVINRHTFCAICFQEPLRPFVHRFS
jgi:hypothetical protein